ncbi:hypothetical protein [Rhodococcus sp. NPDC004095]
MTAPRQTQVESEKPAKVWQVQEVSNKVDTLSEAVAEVKGMIAAQNATYMSRTEIALEFEKRDNKIISLQAKQNTASKVMWSVWSALIPIILAVIWSVIVNNAKVEP